MGSDSRSTQFSDGHSSMAQIDALCDRFERAWKTDQRPRIEDYLERVPPQLQSALLVELLAVELQCRIALGDSGRLEEYLERFADLRDDVRAAFDCAGSGDTVSSVKPKSVETHLSGPAGNGAGPAVGGTTSGSTSDSWGFPQTPRFVNQGLLGEGGMGRVYRARDTERGEDVALKVLLHAEDPGRLARFKDEFRLLSPTEIAHPHLAPLYELLCVDGCWFLTMKLVDGVDFCTYCRPGGVLDLERLRHAFQQLTIGMAALHERGILHRDIKPSNVMVSERDDHVWILDFGLVAHVFEDSLLCATVESVAGTITYMAPEQAGGQAEPASDLYSMGVLLYRCLTGTVPFRGTAMEVLRAKLERDPPPPRDRKPEIPSEWNVLCLALLARDSRARPTPDVVLRWLARGGDEAAAQRPGSGGHETVFCGRKRELEVLRRAYRQVADGRSACVYVSGISGIGKSALVHRFLRELVAERSDVVVLMGKCYELESVPFKAFDSLMDALGRWLRGLSFDAADALTPGHAGALARVFGVLGRVAAIAAAGAREPAGAGEFELRRQAFGALRELLCRLGQRYRLVLVMDDLQWADADSISLLAFLMLLPSPPQLLWIGCYRSEESSKNPVLRELFSLRDKPEYQLAGEELRLEAMPAEDVRRLATRLLRSERRDAAEEALVENVVTETLGHPLLACCYLNEVLADPQFAAEITSGSSLHLDDVIWNRVRRLPEAAQRMLHVVAIAGQPLRERDLFGLAGTGCDDLARLNQLRAEHLVRGVGEGSGALIDTYHDRVRETVLTRLPAHEAEDLHLQLAAAWKPRPPTWPPPKTGRDWNVSNSDAEHSRST